MTKQGEDNRADKKANPYTKKNPAKNKFGFLARWNETLNYLCVDHWILSLIFIAALGAAVAAALDYFGVKLTTRGWGIIGAIIVALYLIIAALHVILKSKLSPYLDVETLAASPASSVGNLLLPANEPDPPVLERILAGKPPDFVDSVKSILSPANTLRLFVGSNIAFTAKDSQTVLRVAGKDLLKINRSPSGILVDAKIFNSDGKIIAQIDKNQFFINEQNAFRIDRPNQHTLIVFDDAAEEVLNVRFLNPSSVILAGIFRFPGRPTLAITEDAVMIGDNPFMRGCITGECGGSLININ